MVQAVEQEGLVDPERHETPNTASERALIREELHKILASRHFQACRRGGEFLQYVVTQELRGHGGLLKERLIGVHIFGRKPDYSTGEDPIVRVQAGDVRRRLERYYADPEATGDVLIQIPLGSYVPVFTKRSPEPGKASDQSEAPTGTLPLRELGGQPESHHENLRSEAAPPKSSEHTSISVPSALTALDRGQSEIPPGAAAAAEPKRVRQSPSTRSGSLAFLIVCLVCLASLLISHRRNLHDAGLEAFWSPVSRVAKPVLLCLPKPMVYKPSSQLFERYEKSHPDSPLTREARQDKFLPLNPAESIQWADMVPVQSSGPGIGGVVAAINISKLLTEQKIRFELRFGDEATYTEMRDSPVVIIGAINSEWATQLTSQAAFAFDETISAPNIHEVGGAKRVWSMEGSGSHIKRDYGLITRQLSGRTGRFLVEVAGISHFGTEAASELLVEQQELAAAMRSKGIDFNQKNLQIVVSTEITDQRSGPPHVVAISSW